MNVSAQVNIITTIAGKAGVPGKDSGDGGPAIYARFHGPYAICVDRQNNIFIADGFNNKIRRIAPSGVISSIAGNDTSGYSGDGGHATNARLSAPQGLAMDNIGNLLIADGLNN